MSWKTITVFILISLSTWSLASPGGNEKIPENLMKVSTGLYQIDGKTYWTLNYENYPKWHTYWKNPGDAGLPIKVQFRVDDEKVNLEPLEWPAPKKYIEEGNLLAFGYEGAYSLFYAVSPQQFKKFQGKKFTIDTNWLICKHVCVPGKATLEGTVQSDKLKVNGQKSSIPANEITQRLNALPPQKPVPNHLDINLVKAPDNSFALFYQVTNVEKNKIDQAANLLTPFPHEPFDFRHEILHYDPKEKVLYGKVPVDWDGEFSEPVLPYPADGKFKRARKLEFLFSDPHTQEAYKVQKTFKTFDLNSYSQKDKFFSMIPKLGETAQAEQKKNSAQSDENVPSIFYYLLLALLGGLILNAMPCVLPVISLKLFGLVKGQGSSRAEILKHNLMYSLGVLTTFLVLALIVIGFKSAGETVGWGFQLQSPKFVAIMLIILFIMALNMFGLFEFGTPGGKTLGGVHLKSGPGGDFFSGVLATILSTPCSAPFLGTALTFAFTSSNSIIILVFLFIGLGLASPFIIIGVFPAMVNFLPRPGMWMDNLKKFLGLTLVLTGVWLYDVLMAQVDDQSFFLYLNLSLTLIFFAFFAYQKIFNSKALGALFFLPALALIIQTSSLELTTSSNPSSGSSATAQVGDLPWLPWSENKMNELKSGGEQVFIDFTAKWCFTCKVNERLVLDTDKFKAIVKKYNLKLLLGDWTKRDPVIGKWLESQGVVGVPAYFVIKKNGELINLGETISINSIESHLSL